MEYEKKQQMNKQNENKLIDADNKLVVTREETERGNMGKGGQLHGDGKNWSLGGEHTIVCADVEL